MWVRIDDTFGDDPRIMSAGVAAAGVLLLGLCFSNRTLGDGWVPAAVIRRLFDGSRAEAEVETITRLLQLGLLQEAERNGIAGYQIHQDLVKLQPTRADVERQRGDRHLQR